MIIWTQPHSSKMIRYVPTKSNHIVYNTRSLRAQFFHDRFNREILRVEHCVGFICKCITLIPISRVQSYHIRAGYVRYIDKYAT